MNASASTAQCVSKAPSADSVTRIWWLLSTADGLDHGVSEAAFAAGIAEGTGEYLAISGEVLTAAALTAPPGRRCPSCVAAAHAAAPAPRPCQSPATSHRRRSRAGLLRWFGFGRARNTEVAAFMTCPGRSARRATGGGEP